MAKLRGTPFAVVPEWVVYGTTPRGLQLYCVLQRHVNANDQAWPGRDRLATLMGCHANTVDRAANELEEIGALLRGRTRKPDGTYAVTAYTVLASNPDHKAPVRHVTSHAPPVVDGQPRTTSGDSHAPPVVTELEEASELEKAPTPSVLAPTATAAVPEHQAAPVRRGPEPQQGQLALVPPANVAASNGHTAGQQCVAYYVDSVAAATGKPPPKRTVGAMAQQAAQLLREGYTADDIRAATTAMLARGKVLPSLLPQFLVEAKLQPQRNPDDLSAEDIFALAAQEDDA